MAQDVKAPRPATRRYPEVMPGPNAYRNFSDIEYREYMAEMQDDESNRPVDAVIDHDLDHRSMDTVIRSELDEVFIAHGILTVEAKREVLSRVYGQPKAASDAELMKDLPPSLQPRAYRRQFDAETFKAAKQVVNLYNRSRKSGEEFSDDDMARVRAARRIVGTERQKGTPPEP